MIAGRTWAVAGWLLPGCVLALMPKCPACLAAYVAVATGLGISFSAAATLRTGLMVACVGAICCVAAAGAFRFVVVIGRPQGRRMPPT